MLGAARSAGARQEGLRSTEKMTLAPDEFKYRTPKLLLKVKMSQDIPIRLRCMSPSMQPKIESKEVKIISRLGMRASSTPRPSLTSHATTSLLPALHAAFVNEWRMSLSAPRRSGWPSARWNSTTATPSVQQNQAGEAARGAGADAGALVPRLSSNFCKLSHRPRARSRL